MVYGILLSVAIMLSSPLEINGIKFFQIGEQDFLLLNGSKITILGSTSGRIVTIMFIHMGQIVAGKKIEVEMGGQRYLWPVKSLRVNHTEVQSYEFIRQSQKYIPRKASTNKHGI